MKRRGLSLLEVVLALAILGVSLAVIGELIRLGTRAGESARDDMEAQLICESLVNEIASGLAMPEMVVDAPVDQYGEWLYSVESQPIDQAGLLAVRVTVRRSKASPSSVAPYSLTRWMIDPNVELAAREAEAVMEQQLADRAQAQASGSAATDAPSTDGDSGGNSGQQPMTTPMGPGAPPDGGGRGGGRRGGGDRNPDGFQLPDGLQLPENFNPGEFNPGRGGRGRGGPDGGPNDRGGRGGR
jgi:prepilin-type N-terminal cleavage/methylation domain-containing protein